jgi:hypothetical protein
MKHLLLAVAFLALHTTQAQKPEKVYGWARVQMPLEWYKQQSAAWRKVIDANPKDGLAWYNYYYANRILGFHDTAYKNNRPFMKKLVEEMGKQLPESYEYNLIQYSVTGYTHTEYLDKAVALGPDRPEHLDYLINNGELNRNIADRDKYSLQKKNTGEMSAGMMYYNFNMMAGLEKNAILLTAGDNDTYPAWALQALGIRKDIYVVNLSLLQMDGYREKLFKELGIEKYVMDWGKTSEDADACRLKFETEILKHLVSNKNKFPVYISLTALNCETYTKDVEQDLYLIGLSYQYSTTPLDNIALLKRNFEKHYQLDYIESAFFQDISVDLVKRINGNYIVPMTKLFDHYQMAGDSEKEDWLRNKLLYISKGTEDEAEVKKHVTKK